MECKVATSCNGDATNTTAKAQTNGRSSHVRNTEKSTKSGLRVNFSEKGEVKERREKFLTAKYGSHQMSLIRKRLAIEMWLLEEIQKLTSLAKLSKEIDIDIDNLLDLDDDEDRRKQVLELLSEIPSMEDVTNFIDQLLEKMKTL